MEKDVAITYNVFGLAQFIFANDKATEGKTK
jgi:hypothetical protein